MEKFYMTDDTGLILSVSNKYGSTFGLPVSVANIGKTILEVSKIEKIKKLHSKYQKEYEDYLNQYPQREVESFNVKQAEATAYRLDSSSPTPTISAMVGGDDAKRVELINAVLAKIDYLALQEGNMLAKRDEIKACGSLEELELIDI